MERKGLVVLCAGLIALSIGLGILVTLIPPIGNSSSSDSGNVRNYISVVLKVYKNGKLVREEAGDPISDTWIKAVVSTLFQLYRRGMTFTYTDGTTAGYIHNDAYSNSGRTKGVLAIGTDGSQASASDIKLYSLYMMQELGSSNYLIQDNSAWINVTISHTFVVNKSVSIAEAGMMLKDGNGKYILVCRDAFSPISLNTDDGLTIEYDFDIRKDPPFTEYFWGVIINVFLGYQGSNGGNAWHGHVFYTTNSGRGSEETKPYKINKVKWALVLSNDAWSPLVTLTNTTSPIDLDMTKVSWSIGSQEFNLHIRLSEYDQKSYRAYGVAFYVYVATGTGSYNWAKYSTKLLAYIRYSNSPLTINRYTYQVIDLGVNFNG